jgi:hypothetical protein
MLRGFNGIHVRIAMLPAEVGMDKAFVVDVLNSLGSDQSITLRNILKINRDIPKRRGVSVFKDLAREVPVDHSMKILGS